MDPQDDAQQSAVLIIVVAGMVRKQWTEASGMPKPHGTCFARLHQPPPPPWARKMGTICPFGVCSPVL